MVVYYRKYIYIFTIVVWKVLNARVHNVNETSDTLLSCVMYSLETIQWLTVQTHGFLCFERIVAYNFSLEKLNARSFGLIPYQIVVLNHILELKPLGKLFRSLKEF